LRTKRLASWHSSWGHEPIFFLTNSKTCRLPLLQKVIRQDPKFADAIYRLGKIQLEQGETKAAILNLETSAKLNPRSDYLHYQLSLAYQRDLRSMDAEGEMKLYQALKVRRRGRGESQSD
jgi:tetratricopeptide (TPR) repeat protein